MFRNKLLGIAAAATLGSAAMLGSTSAYALKVADDSAPGSRADLMALPDSVTYASETLVTTAAQVTEVDGDSTKYYNINDVLVLSAPADIGANVGHIYIVQIMLDGMVFRGAATLAGASPGSFNLLTGGASGDKMAVFQLSSDGAVAAATGILSLTANYAVSADGGSATLIMTNRTLADLADLGVSSTKTHSGNVIKIEPALNEVSTKMNATADVAADGFMKFENDMTTVTVGSLMVGYKEMRRLMSDGSNADAVTDIMDTTDDTTVTPNVPNSTVTFSGDFSFASHVGIHSEDDCSADEGTDTDAITDLRKMEGEGDDAVVASTTMPVNVTELATAHFLCITVDPMADDAMRIPATSAYTAMGSYKGITDAAIGPVSMEQTLGMIERNGTTIRLPYLSTNDKFNQRIRMVNRSSADVMYEMEFHGEGDEAGMDASGMLEKNSITVLSLRTDDVVKAGNGNNTSGTIIVEAQPGMIDVATVQINRETGNTDTVVYSPEE